MEEQGHEAPKIEAGDAEMTPGTEKGENEQLQSEPTEEGKYDWKDGETPQEQLHQREVADEQDADTQEPTSLNIPIEISTQIGIDEPEAEVIPDFVEEFCTVTPEPSQGTEPRGMKPQQQNDDEVEQDADT